jgi:sporulation protein YabP
MGVQIERHCHEVVASERRSLRVFGVKEVDSFDEFGAVLKTDMGELTVEGEELKIGTLDIDRGEVALNGKINGLFYSDDVRPSEKKGLLSKMFK